MAPFLDDASAQRTVPVNKKIPIVASPEAPQLFGWPLQNDRGYSIKEQPMGSKRHLRVVVLGAGASGINFSKVAGDKLENVDVVCYEKNDDVGGTWLENM